MRYGSVPRLGDTLSFTYLCFKHSSEAQINLFKLPLEVLNQMVSADEGLGANQRDSGGPQTKRVSFPRVILHTAPSVLEAQLASSCEHQGFGLLCYGKFHHFYQRTYFFWYVFTGFFTGLSLAATSIRPDCDIN